MKIFLVFCAVFVLFVGSLCFHSDLCRYVLIQNSVKSLAEDLACGAALLLSETAYSDGQLCFDRPVVESYVTSQLAHAERSAGLLRGGTLSATLILLDDLNGYGSAEKYGVHRRLPAVCVELTYEADRLFRLPFMDIPNLSRTAVYQWEAA